MAKEAKPAAVAEKSEPGVWANGKLLFRLSRPVQVGDDTIESLTLREPGTKDILEVGNPCKFDPAADPPTVNFDDRRMGDMIARLANVPPSTVGRIPPKDFLQLQWVVAPFFIPV